jgi:hypothetical protein
LLEVVPVKGSKALKAFIKVPWTLYAQDPAWVPPLFLERWQHFSARNPYFAHAKHQFWVACRNKRPVGRISAQIDQLHLERYRNATGFFGLLEGEDDAEVFHALLDTAETWLRSRGMGQVMGPFSLSINQECGLLVDGFDSPPSIMMGHALPYYAVRLEEAGYKKEQDMLAYHLDANFSLSPAMRAVIAKAGKQVRVRAMNRSRFKEELQVLRDIFEDAWANNWGFVPFTEAEFNHLGDSLKLLVDDDFVQIAEVDGVPAAMIVGLPNVNEIIRDLNGRLFPVGWLKVLWRLKVRFPKSARVALMGVRRQYQDSLLGAALAFTIIDAVRPPGVRKGVEEVELSWILEDNTRMRHMIEALGGVAYKRYRIYGRTL